MLEIPNYAITDELFSSSKSIVFRGMSELDGQPAIFKTFAGKPRDEDIFRLKREFDILQELSGSGAPLPFDLAHAREKVWLVMEDIGGESLDRLYSKKLPDIKAFFRIAAPTARCLGKIHEKRLIHRDINPSNIVMNPKTGILKIIDFDIVTEISCQTQAAVNPTRLEGTLAFMSPEQTGRMNRMIDYRSDLYSLGATFYRLLTGRNPFPSEDAMELVHYHIARTPIPPHELNPNIPLPLSDIVMTLMSKTAEERYQSAFGLCADLELCRQDFLADKTSNKTNLKHVMVSDQFQISQKLYGRESHIEALTEAFDRISRGKPELMLISGYSGLGKSALIHEIQKPIVGKRGFFIEGRFDQFNKNIPYVTFFQALRDLIHHLLTESELQIAFWRENIKKALGSNGRIITEVIPEVELIIGTQPPVPDLPASEAKNRHSLVFRNFVKVFATDEHPLVLFLDDCQWIDASSLKLLSLLLMDSQTRNLFIIGAYRTDELDGDHPLRAELKRVQEAGACVNAIHLDPLSVDHISQLLADTLRRSREDVEALAEVCREKTLGNPFFVNLFLRTLYKEKFIYFDSQSASWRWDVDQIREAEITDNVITLMTRRIRKLPVESQEILKRAACLGTSFDLQTLATISETSRSKTATCLKMALEEGLIVPLEETYRYILESDSANGWFQFVHDRVMLAARSLIPSPRLKEICLKAGSLLLRGLSNKEREQRIFEIVNHYNTAQDLLKDITTRITAARLNYEAGLKAKRSAAYESAYNYLKISLRFLPSDRWKKSYKLTLAIYEDLAEAAYLNQEYANMHRLIGVIFHEADHALDKVKAYEIKVQAQACCNQSEAAIHSALEILNELGVQLPVHSSKTRVFLGYLNTRIAIAPHIIKNLVNLKRMRNPKQLAISRIFNCITVIMLMASPKMFTLLVFHWIHFSIRHGNGPLSAFAYMSYGMILCKYGKYRDAYQFGDLSLQVMKAFNPGELQPSIYVGNYAFIAPWTMSLRDTAPKLTTAHRQALELGDLEYAAYSAHFELEQMFFLGENLEDLGKRTAQYYNLFSRLKRENTLPLLLNLKRFCACLTGKSGLDAHFPEDHQDDEHLGDLNEKDHGAAILNFHFLAMIRHYYYKNFEAAHGHALQADKFMEMMSARLILLVYTFYATLIQLELCKECAKDERLAFLENCETNLKKLRKWSKHAPGSSHKLNLAEAGYARVRGRIEQAEQFYRKAMAMAREQEFCHEEALSCELAARFYLARGNIREGNILLRSAHVGYLRWGARAKADRLRLHYPHAFSAIEPVQAAETTTSNIIDSFDINSVIKASQAISGEIVLGRLLEKLMNILIENAGARKGLLVLEESETGALMVEARGEDGCVQSDCSQPLNQCRDLSISIVNYVARTQENVVLKDALGEGLFVSDPYVMAHRPKSVLCMPILFQGKTIGILYLENNLSSGAFTEDRLNVLKMLSSQAAISIQNAQFYTRLQESNRTLEQKVETRTGELKKSNDELKTMDLIVETINRETGLERVLRTILEQGLVLFGNANKGLFLRWNIEEFHFELASFTGPDNGMLPEASFTKEDVKRLYLQDEWEMGPGLYLIRYEGDVDVKARLVISMSLENQLVGLLIFDNHENRIGFDQISPERLDRFRQHALTALDKARFLAKLKQKNEEIVKAQEKLVMQEKMASLGTLTAGIAHEIKNPLNFVNNLSGLATELVAELNETLKNVPMDEETREEVDDISDALSDNAEVIARHGKRANRIVQSMMNFARGGKGEKVDTDINRLVDEFAEMTHAGIRSPGRPIILNKDFDKNRPTIPVVPQSLSRVLVNLITNAFDAVLEKTRANRDFQPEVLVSTHRFADRVEIRVRDNGPGISKEHKEKIFTPFFTTKPPDTGNIGLGLSICYEIMTREHDGRLTLESMPGEFTEFTMVLPFK